MRIADRLGIQQFEQHRTHWAIKDGDIPAELIATGTAERAQRTVAVVAAEYVEARREGRRREAAELAEELEDFPPSLEKALSLVPARILQQPTPELYPILGIEPRTPEGRNAVVAVVARDHNGRTCLPTGLTRWRGSWTFTAARRKRGALTARWPNAQCI
ncbi:hypothetical protein [Mesorhizobium sp. M0678]|uniref:hypothetical protein n=1 Tax=Mesorhizobium sp. M0678 TaxID=2956985 RepID=UPI0033376625